MPSDGRLIACDIDAQTTAVAQRYWKEAGVADRIELRLQPALDTIGELIGAGEEGRFDFAFIDADKENYDSYYEGCLRLLRPGGVIAIDNVLWDGAVVDPKNREATTQAIRALNAKLAKDKRVAISLVPIGDGLTLACKLP
jgi:caffeoyl-CoA O-methyltransferase